jgi:hypothetical protein
MTPEQERQFNRFGCFPRCLIELAKRAQNPITRDQFCERFAHKFRDPQEKYGALDPDYIPEVARDLSLLTLDGSVPTGLAPVEDYDKLVAHFKPGMGVLIASHLSLNEGSTEPEGHCSILEKIDSEFFHLWTPIQGEGHRVPRFPRRDWVLKQCKGMIFV